MHVSVKGQLFLLGREGGPLASQLLELRRRGSRPLCARARSSAAHAAHGRCAEATHHVKATSWGRSRCAEASHHVEAASRRGRSRGWGTETTEQVHAATRGGRGRGGGRGAEPKVHSRSSSRLRGGRGGSSAAAAATATAAAAAAATARSTLLGGVLEAAAEKARRSSCLGLLLCFSSSVHAGLDLAGAVLGQLFWRSSRCRGSATIHAERAGRGLDAFTAGALGSRVHASRRSHSRRLRLVLVVAIETPDVLDA